jgi:hypothetical protein
MPHRIPRLGRTALASAVAVVAAGGVGVATGAIPSSPGASPASNGVIHACYRRGSGNGRSSGSLRVIDFAAGVRCATSETLHRRGHREAPPPARAQRLWAAYIPARISPAASATPKKTGSSASERPIVLAGSPLAA